MASLKLSFNDGSSLSLKEEENIIRAYLESLDCPRALSVWLCFKYDHTAFLSLDFSVSDYLDFPSFKSAYYATLFLSKYEGWDFGLNLRNEGIERFLQSEVTCFQTNERLRGPFRRDNSRASHVFDMARVKIEKILGDLSSDVLEFIFNKSGFGPGVTTSVKGKWLTPSEKLESATCTPLLDTALSVLTERDFPFFTALHKRTVESGNHVVTVPKNSKTDRTIAVEPGINAFFQKGVGTYIRRRLKIFGIDLNDQTRNQQLAQMASLQGDHTTVDLSAASDSLTIEAVRLLLPQKWVTLLEVLRSPNYKLDGRWFRYEKHSSMGNGYTFELESLVFFAIAWASCLGYSGEIGVYGDDIVIPTDGFPVLSDALDVLGFATNPDKTFCSGPFRESCGKHYWNGRECTPFFFKRTRSARQVITFANWLYPQKEYMSVWLACYRGVDRRFALKGPNGPGTHFVVPDWDLQGVVSYVYRYGRRFWRYRTMMYIGEMSSEKSCGHALFSLASRSIPSNVIDASERYVLEPVNRGARGSGRWVSKYVLTDDLSKFISW